MRSVGIGDELEKEGRMDGGRDGKDGVIVKEEGRWGKRGENETRREDGQMRR